MQAREAVELLRHHCHLSLEVVAGVVRAVSISKKALREVVISGMEALVDWVAVLVAVMHGVVELLAVEGSLMGLDLASGDVLQFLIFVMH